MNGREFPTSDTGYISTLVINKATQQVVLRPFISEVPGFSAAMVQDASQFWVTSWMQTNDVYQVSTAQLLAQAASGRSYKFNDLFKKSFGGFEGMSSFALHNQNGFLFYNADYDSYSVSAQTSKVLPVSPSCEPLMGWQSQWIVLCNSHSLELWSN